MPKDPNDYADRYADARGAGYDDLAARSYADGQALPPKPQKQMKVKITASCEIDYDGPLSVLRADDGIEAFDQLTFASEVEHELSKFQVIVEEVESEDED